MIMCLYVCVWLGITCGLLPLGSICCLCRLSFTWGQRIHWALHWKLLIPFVDESLHCLMFSTGWPCSSGFCIWSFHPLWLDLNSALESRHPKTFVNTTITVFSFVNCLHTFFKLCLFFSRLYTQIQEFANTKCKSLTYLAKWSTALNDPKHISKANICKHLPVRFVCAT